MFDKPENITTWDKFNSFCKQTVYIDTKFINNFIESIKGKTKAISSDDMLDSIQILLKNMNKEIEIDSIKENKGLLLYCFIPIIEFYEKQGF